MPVNSVRIPLSQEETDRLPDGSAVYILWREEVPIHAGFVTPHTQSLSERLRMHVPMPGDEPTPGGPTHFSYLMTENPLKQLAEVLPLLDGWKETPNGAV